jgi:hypothetical protein
MPTNRQIYFHTDPVEAWIDDIIVNLQTAPAVLSSAGWVARSNVGSTKSWRGTQRT